MTISVDEEEVAQAAAEFIPTNRELHHEVARRVVSNAKLATSLSALRDQVLIILSDYRDHSWAEGRLKSEGIRLLCADAIMAKVHRSKKAKS